MPCVGEVLFTGGQTEIEEPAWQSRRPPGLLRLPAGVGGARASSGVPRHKAASDRQETVAVTGPDGVSPLCRGQLDGPAALGTRRMPRGRGRASLHTPLPRPSFCGPAAEHSRGGAAVWSGTDATVDYLFSLGSSCGVYQWRFLV